MRFLELLEGRSHPCIVVDVQPEYAKAFLSSEIVCQKIIQFVNTQTGPVLMYVNAEEQGLSGDTIDDIKMYWEDSGFSPDNWHRVQIIDKGYGFLRSWMDGGISPAAIIKTIRFMYQSKVNDSRELFGGEDSDEYEQGMKNLLGWEYKDWMSSDPLTINNFSVAQLKKFSGAYLMGGGRNECLREVELIMNASNIKYKRINSLIYG
jgi:hypothetical protein